jgi:hypothetical protein
MVKKKKEKTRRDEKTDHKLKTKGNNEPGGRILTKARFSTKII